MHQNIPLFELSRTAYRSARANAPSAESAESLRLWMRFHKLCLRHLAGPWWLYNERQQPVKNNCTMPDREANVAHKEIELRAYHIFLDRGGAHGHDVED
jgi:hypothetical protein